MSEAREIEEAATQPSGEEEKVYVAVSDDIKEDKSTLVWAVKNLPRDAKIVIAHVHVPAQMIPFMGTKLHVNYMEEQDVKAYRHLERQKMGANLDQYVKACTRLKVTAEKLVIEKNDISQGILELISLHGVTRLVMGAAANKRYSKKMKTPKSNKAIRVMEKADPFCMIWFICKEALICTRTATGTISAVPPSPAPSSWSDSNSSITDRIGSLSPQQGSHEMIACRSVAVNWSRQDRGSSSVPTRLDNLIRPGVVGLIYPWDGIPRDEPQHSEQSLGTVHNDLVSNTRARGDADDSGIMMHPSTDHESDDGTQFLSPRTCYPESLGMDTDVYEKCKEALNETEAAKREAFEESNKRRIAEMDLLSALQKSQETDTLYQAVMKQRQRVEEMLVQERQENNDLRSQINDVYNKLREAEEGKLENEQRLREMENGMKELEDKLLATQQLMQSLELENDNLQRERNEALGELEEKKEALQKMLVTSHKDLSAEFSFDELKAATSGFTEEQKIGEGGFGSVYRGMLRNTPVAVKLLHQDGMQGISEFHQEIAVLSRVRHPNLVTLIGSCPEACALVYDYLPNGSLEDRLTCSYNTPPLTWQARTRIIGEICTALIFLHSNQPHSVVHGDLKPENILLDANLVSKLSDFGICRMLIQYDTRITSVHRTTCPKGTFAYMDPVLLSTGELTPKSDVYSFGIIILRLLTGWQPLNISNRVEEAVENGNLHSVIDLSAGEWPFVQAIQLALLGLRCTELSRKKRADLMTDVWPVIQPMMKVAGLSARPLSFASASDDQRIPSYFMCPITQEIMRDPHIAADGFTYEAEAIRGWLSNGRDTSPMTNLKLANTELISNRTLRSAILEWVPQLNQ